MSSAKSYPVALSNQTSDHYSALIAAPQQLPSDAYSPSRLTYRQFVLRNDLLHYLQQVRDTMEKNDEAVKNNDRIDLSENMNQKEDDVPATGLAKIEAEIAAFKAEWRMFLEKEK